MTNYYGCMSPDHTEFTCLTHYYHNPRFKRARWCQPCLARYPEGIGID